MTTPADVIARIDGFPSFYAVASSGLMLLMQPGRKDEFSQLDIATVALPRGDGTQVSIAMDQSFDAIETDPDNFNLEFLRTLFGMMLADLVHDLKDLGYSLADNDPDAFHVLRHIRNSVAHGNRFDIRNANAKIVSFNRLTVDPSMHGKGPVLFDIAPPWLIFDLFTEVRGQL
jgi:hypothetical protein